MDTASKDIFNYVLAFSVLLFTVFLVWFLYYLIRMVRDASQIIHDIREKVAEVGEVIETLKDKLTASASTVAVAAKGVERIVAFVQKRRNEKTEEKPSRKKKS